jgi:hypothetical protein
LIVDVEDFLDKDTMEEGSVTLFNDHVLLKKGKVSEFSIIMQQLD